MERKNYWTGTLGRQMRRRRFLGTSATAGIGLGAMALTGCGGDDDDADSGNGNGNGDPTNTPGAGETPDASPTTASDVTYGGTPTVVWETEPVGVFDPHVTASGFVLSTRNMVFNGFYYLKYPELEYEPEIAESHENPEPGTFLVTLRPGIKLHDESEEVSAELAKYSMERILEPGKSQAGGYTGSARGLQIEVIDELNLRLTFDPPSAQNLEALLCPGAGITGIVSRQAAERLGDDFWQEPVGTGPFRVSEWQTGSSLTYEKWPQYFLQDANGNALPYLDGLVAIDLPDATVRVLNLQSGQTDLTPISPIDVETLQGDDNIEIVPSGDTRMQFTLNHNKAPFENIHYRHALNYAIDRQALADALYYGYGRPAGGIQENSQWYNPDFEQAGFDPERVRAELEAAGTPDGFSFACAVLPSGVRRQMAELVQGQLRQFGIEFEILPMESVDYVARLYGSGELDGFFATNLIPGQGEVSGFEGIRESATRADLKTYPELVAVTDQIPTTFDPEERKALIWEAQEIYYKQLSLQPVLVDTPQLYAARRDWTGVGFVSPIGLAGNYASYRGIRQA